MTYRVDGFLEPNGYRLQEQMDIIYEPTENLFDVSTFVVSLIEVDASDVVVSNSANSEVLWYCFVTK